MENKNQNPPIPPPLLPTKKWYQHKGLIAIIILALLVAVFAWIYFADEPGQNVRPIVVQHKAIQSQQMASSTLSGMDTSNWQTYNSNLGFSIEYPNNWFATSSPSVPNVQFSNYQTPPPFSEQTLQSVSQFSVTMVATGKNLNLNKWFQSEISSGSSASSVPAIVVGYSAIKIQTLQNFGDELTDYYVSVGPNIYDISYIDAAPQSEPSQFLDIYQAMINSISFLSQYQPSLTIFNQLNDKYNLFVPVPNNTDCGPLPDIQYYDEGTITSGPYSGYHRIIAGVQACGPPGGNYAYVFATKDYQTFIAQGSPSDYESAKAASPNNGDDIDFNYDNVVNFANFPNDNPPASIQLGNFVLVQNDYWYGDAPTSSPMTELVPGLTMYADPGQSYTRGWNPDNTYLGSDDDVLVKTPTGSIFDYLLVSQEEFNNSSGTADSLDGIFYKEDQIFSNASLYETYGQIAPGACGGLPTTYVLNNISQNDLAPIGTTKSGVALYTLKESNQALNHDEYNSKGGYTVPSSYADYVAKNPVLILQDPWNRWIGLGEFDNSTPGGCGKPVIYLYPPKPTEVTVKFVNSVRLSLDIPTYAGQWDVLASPDGELKDLQPQDTDCSKINYNLVGSEYAQAACQTGVYPYLYWEGQASGRYPTANQGWIVGKNDIATFLDSKLTEIGLSEKEKTDMMAYWVPQLLAKNTPYYRMSFFQTQTMDNFIPMQVTPKPDTTIRVFLDWSPLATQPSAPLQPEVLNHINRTGFTLVEWGGLKQ